MILNISRIRSKFELNKLNAVLRGVIVAIILALLPIIQISGAEPELATTTRTALKLDTSSHNVVSEASLSKATIVVGESIVDRDARIVREKTEAEALALKQSREVIARETRVYKPAFPENIDLTSVYKAAAATYGIADWRYLKAIHYVETGCAVNQLRKSSAGASGPMQFLPSTWRSWGADGDGDGKADISNAYDAIYGASRYLAVSGGGSDIRKALYSYNHSTSYVNKVTGVAMSISN